MITIIGKKGTEGSHRGLKYMGRESRNSHVAATFKECLERSRLHAHRELFVSKVTD